MAQQVFQPLDPLKQDLGEEELELKVEVVEDEANVRPPLSLSLPVLTNSSAERRRRGRRYLHFSGRVQSRVVRRPPNSHHTRRPFFVDEDEHDGICHPPYLCSRCRGQCTIHLDQSCLKAGHARAG